MTADRRTDWLLRQYVEETEFALKFEGLDEMVARARMCERLVPLHVQDKIIGRAGIRVTEISAVEVVRL